MKKLILVIVVMVIIGFMVFWGRNSLPILQPESGVSNNHLITTVSPTITANTVCSSLTKSTTEGPYYITGTKFLSDNNLNYANLPGTPIRVSGVVYSGTGNKPVAHAKIELWQADNSGTYHPNANGDAAQYTNNQLALRGYILSDEQGHFTFTSIYPGYYEGRARHIHARISADHYQAVTTQIIFQPEKGDGVTVSNDSIAQSLPACNLLNMTEQQGMRVGTIDFRLKPL